MPVLEEEAVSRGDSDKELMSQVEGGGPEIPNTQQTRLRHELAAGLPGAGGGR